MSKYKNRFVFSISDKTRQQLDAIAAEHECSAAAILRRLIKAEYDKVCVANKD